MTDTEINDEDILNLEKFSIDKELDSVIDSLRESRSDMLKILHLCDLMKESLKKGTKDQLFALDALIKDYSFLEEDVDVNGERVKKIIKALIEKAKDEGIDQAKLDEFKKKETWSFDW